MDRPRRSATSNRPSASAIDSYDDLVSFEINFNLIILSCSVAYILFRWREKIRTSVPLTPLTLYELVAILLLLTSSIFLVVCCFAKYFYKPDDDIDQDRTIHRPFPNSITPNLYRPLHKDEDEDENDIIIRVVSGEIPSCSLNAAEIRREVLQWLPLQGFDHESIFRQTTTDGCLVASTTRGCKEFYTVCVLLRDGIARAPVVRSSRFSRLEDIKCGIAGKNLYFRFRSSTGNFCPNKKPAAVNWIQGRGKSVVDVVNMVLTGSAISGSLGGFNANIVSAVFLSTGQDVESSHCITMIEAVNDGKYLHVSVTMPSIQVGTQLASLSACPNLLRVKGTSKEPPGSNSLLLAAMVVVSVLAVEFSLMSAIAFVAGRLIKICMQYNRPSNDIANLGSYPPNIHSLTSS